MNNILIASAGQRVSLVRAFQKEIKQFHPDGKVYAVDMNPALAPACHVSDGFDAVPRASDENYIPKLIAICKKREVQMIVPTIDTELLKLAANREELSKNGLCCIVSDLDFVRICRDKRQTNEFFKARNIEVPNEIDKDNLSFPLFVKPYDGSLSKDSMLIKTESQMPEGMLENPKLMFMEYMDSSEYDEYTVDTYYDRLGNVRCIVPRKRIFVRAGEINKGVTEKNEIVLIVKELLSNIPGARGCLTMQFFLGRKNRRIVGIEINARFGGGFPLSYAAGANYPGWLINEYIENGEVSYFEGWEDRLLMLRYDDEVLVPNYEG